MPLLATGLNHRSAHIDLREQAAFQQDTLPAALDDLLSQPNVQEGLIVSTCNRTEIYTFGGAPEQIHDWVARQRGLALADLRQHSYVKLDTDAAEHALRVACGLDSLVLGEPQILGQMKQAWQHARRGGALGPVLERLFQHAFGTAKVVRHATALGAGQVSVAACAARIASEIFGSLRGRDVLIIGAGETAELMARYLADNGRPRMTIANRTQPRAQALAQEFNGASCGLDALPQFVGVADVIVGCAALDQPILDAQRLRAAIGRRKRKPVLMLDLGVPRNFAEDVASSEDVFLYGVDDLQSRVDVGAAGRAAAAEEASRIVTARSEEFSSWLQSRELDLGLTTLEQRWQNELAVLQTRALARLQAGDDPQAVLERMQHAAIRRLLHAPRRHVRELPQELRGRAVNQLQSMFDLPPVDPTDDQDT